VNRAPPMGAWVLIQESWYESLEASLWCASRSVNFPEAVLAAANLGHDADTTAAITGQLAGALFGYSGIPEVYRKKLAWHDVLLAQADGLFEQSMRDRETSDRIFVPEHV
ncbi:ADP-ribosylglycohydrolase family protein, partial [Camelimonas fluminis]